MAVGAYIKWEPVDPIVYKNGAVSIVEAASQTFVAGTPVYLDSNGRIAAATTTPTSIFGVAMSAGQNGTAGQYETIVLPLRVTQKWKMALLEALTQNLLGQTAGKVGVVKDATTGLWYCSTADTGDQVWIVDYVRGPAGSAIGDTKGTVIVEFLSTVLQVL